MNYSFNSLKKWSFCCRCGWKWIWIELFMLNYIATYLVVYLCTQLSSFPAGCSSSSSSGDASDSDRPLHGIRRACPAKRGVTSYASCCHTSSLECRLKEHDSTGLTEQVIYSQQVSINTMNTKTNVWFLTIAIKILNLFYNCGLIKMWFWCIFLSGGGFMWRLVDTDRLSGFVEWFCRSWGICFGKHLCSSYIWKR